MIRMTEQASALFNMNEQLRKMTGLLDHMALSSRHVIHSFEELSDLSHKLVHTHFLLDSLIRPAEHLSEFRHRRRFEGWGGDGGPGGPGGPGGRGRTGPRGPAGPPGPPATDFEGREAPLGQAYTLSGKLYDLFRRNQSQKNTLHSTANPFKQQELALLEKLVESQEGDPDRRKKLEALLESSRKEQYSFADPVSPWLSLPITPKSFPYRDPVTGRALRLSEEREERLDYHAPDPSFAGLSLFQKIFSATHEFQDHNLQQVVRQPLLNIEEAARLRAALTGHVTLSSQEIENIVQRMQDARQFYSRRDPESRRIETGFEPTFSEQDVQRLREILQLHRKRRSVREDLREEEAVAQHFARQLLSELQGKTSLESRKRDEKSSDRAPFDYIEASKRALMFSSTVASAGAPDAMETLAGSFKLLAAQIGYMMVPTVMRASTALQAFYRSIQSLSPESKERLGNYLGAGALLAGGVIGARALGLGKALPYLAPLMTNPWTITAGVTLGTLALDQIRSSQVDDSHKTFKPIALYEGNAWIPKIYVPGSGRHVEASNEMLELDKRMMLENIMPEEYKQRYSQYTDAYNLMHAVAKDVAESDEYKRYRNNVTSSAPVLRMIGYSQILKDLNLKYEQSVKDLELLNRKLNTAIRTNNPSYAKTLLRDIHKLEDQSMMYELKIASIQGLRDKYVTEPQTKQDKEFLDNALQKNLENVLGIATKFEKPRSEVIKEFQAEKEQLKAKLEFDKFLAEHHQLLFSVANVKPPAYLSPEDLHRSMQLSALGLDPLQEELRRIQLESLQLMLENLPQQSLHLQDIRRLLERLGVNFKPTVE